MSTICQTPSFCNALVAPNINFIAQYLYIVLHYTTQYLHYTAQYTSLCYVAKYPLFLTFCYLVFEPISSNSCRDLIETYPLNRNIAKCYKIN